MSRKPEKTVFDEMDTIETRTLSSDLPDEFIGTVTSVFKDAKKGQFAGTPVLKLVLKLEDGEETITVYNIPKAWTGRGQMDILKASLKDLNLELRDLPGNTFRWKRQDLPGAMKGNARHYPTEIIG